MRTINCAIIEDEPLGAKSLSALLKSKHPEYEVVKFGKTLQEARDLFNDKAINLYFTDIELLDGNIFEVLRDTQLGKGKYIVFTTAYEEFGAKAFSYPALHYLMKPINPPELAKAITRYEEVAFNEGNSVEKDPKLESLQQFGQNKLVLPTQNGTSFIDINSIIHIQSSNKYSVVFTTDRKQHIVVKPLTRFEEVLADKGFIRVHDSHIVNIHHVVVYLKGKGGEIVMSDESHVPVAARRKDALSAILKNVL
ncbi:MAG: DNA-binding response regulator [Bacteroidota bacterium]|nr:DNA-binding response regulator [Bacteroidota bacterium]